MNETLLSMHQRRDESVGRRKDLVDFARRQRPGDANLNTFKYAEFRRLTTGIEDYDARIAELQAEEEHLSSSNAVLRRAVLGGAHRGSHVYGPGARASYFADLVAVSRQTADGQTRERLGQYDQEQRDLNRADGSGGQFVPPAFLMSDYAGLPRPGRGTSHCSFSSSHRSTSARPSCSLLASFVQQLDDQVLSGSGATGQVLCLRNVAGIRTVTWTSATPTAQDLQKRVADAVSRLAGSLFGAPNAIVTAPRRWASTSLRCCALSCR